MKFYTQTHQHVCGIDLHTKTMYLCILNDAGDMCCIPIFQLNLNRF